MQKDENEIEESTKNDIPIKGSEENNFEIEDIEKNNSEIKSICKYCLQPIMSGAKICHNCGKHQSKLSRAPYYFATLAIPLAVVIFAGLQVWVNILQYDEAKAKRVEAEKVLEKAEEVRKKAETVLSDAKESLETANKLSNEAKAEANKVLTLTRNESKAVIDKANEARRGFDQASKEVKLNLEESNKRIALAENNFNNLASEIGEMKKDFTSELAILKDRNELVAIADNAVVYGDRASLEKLDKIIQDENESLRRRTSAGAENLRVYSYYLSGTRISSSYDLKFTKDDQVIKNDEISTNILIHTLNTHNNWLCRGQAAKLLADRKEKEVPEALIKSIKMEPRLDVLECSIKSFCSVTGYKKNDIFKTQRIIDWWEENKERVESELSIKE